MRLQRPGEIDYYEELGVDRNAPSEEIRDSFRALARLLHPDHQQDEHLKVIAEKQLRRVNRIYAVLSDPERRRRYDELLADDFRPPTIVFNPGVFNPGVFNPDSAVTARKLVSRFVWAAAAALGVAGVIWIATDQPSSPVYSAERPGAASRTVSAASMPYQESVSDEPNSNIATAGSSGQTSLIGQSDQIALLRAQLRNMRMERDEARREVARLSGTQISDAPALPSPSSSATTANSTSVTDPGPPHLTPPIPRPALASLGTEFRNTRPPGTEAHQFAGFWYFARPTGQRPRNLYPPEFIEATLTESNGVVHGKYRSRYQIVDRAISPDVNFEFSGTPSGGAITCMWSGQGGAKGQLTLRITGENDLKVDWSASEMGNVQGLASGTAVLTRRID
jgi:curved DNA-binding protein CbpA